MLIYILANQCQQLINRLTDDYKAQEDKRIAFFKETETLIEDMEAVSSKILNANHVMMNRLQVVENILGGEQNQPIKFGCCVADEIVQLRNRRKQQPVRKAPS